MMMMGRTGLGARSRRVAAVVALGMVGMTGASASAQCTCPVGESKVDWNGGTVGGVEASYCVMNAYGSNQFQIGGTELHLGDPTVMMLEVSGVKTYYITGTSTDKCSANFEIYKTTDFRTFTFLMNAFPDGSRSGRYMTINGTRYTNLWSPQLYVDPADSTQVFMTFSATAEYTYYDQDGGDLQNKWVNTLYPSPQTSSANANSVANSNNGCSNPPVDGATVTAWKNRSGQFLSCYLVAINKSNFTAGTSQFGALSHQGPMWYGYQDGVGGFSGTWRYDGGKNKNLAIPTSSNMSLYAYPSCTGAPIERRLTGSLAHRCWNTLTWMADGPFVFFDPPGSATPQRWMFYGWNDTYGSPDDWWGNHIAAHKMLDHIRMDNTFSALPMVHARNKNASLKLNGNSALPGCSPSLPSPIPQGTADKDGYESNYAVAEGPCVFKFNNTYYLLYSRNHWTSEAYNICYKKASTLAGLQLASYNTTTDTAERILLQMPNSNPNAAASPYPVDGYCTNDRMRRNGHNFGHADVVMLNGALDGDTQRPYIIFHAKRDQQHLRVLHMKELRFYGIDDSTPVSDPNYGHIMPLTVGGSDARFDVDRVYLLRCQ